MHRDKHETHKTDEINENFVTSRKNFHFIVSSISWWFSRLQPRLKCLCPTDTAYLICSLSVFPRQFRPRTVGAVEFTLSRGTSSRLSFKRLRFYIQETNWIMHLRRIMRLLKINAANVQNSKTSFKTIFGASVTGTRDYFRKLVYNIFHYKNIMFL